MNRLWLRLAFAFAGVTLLGVATAAVLAGAGIGRDFLQYAEGQAAAQDPLAGTLAAYYAEHGTWAGVEGVVPIGGPVDVLVADAYGHVVFDSTGLRTGEALTPEAQLHAAHIQSSGSTVGYLMITAGSGALSAGAQHFLEHLYSTLIIATLVAVVLGILVGLLVSRTLTDPLAATVQAARAFAQREWDRRVAVRGADEIADVGRAFNLMADSLQQSETLRRNLIADIAHELGTPLTVIQGNLRALLDGVYPLEQQEIATLYDETRLLARLVDDLRELALADAGQLPLKLERVDLAALLRAAAERFTLAAEAQGVDLALVPGGALLCVRADACRVEQILANLLANALRHTPPGGRVTLASDIVAESGLPARARVSIADTGTGIAPEDLSHVFERFYRGDKSRARSSGGAGLGLAIARAWVTAMGGEIGVESTVGAGSCFWFTLPGAR